MSRMTQPAGFGEAPGPAIAPPAQNGCQRVQVAGPDGEAVVVLIPVIAGRILRAILGHAGTEDEVVVVPPDAVVGIEDAADLMNVSPGFVARLSAEGQLSVVGTGPETRLLLADVVRHDAAAFASFLTSMEEITAIDQELGLR